MCSFTGPFLAVIAPAQSFWRDSHPKLTGAYPRSQLDFSPPGFSAPWGGQQHTLLGIPVSQRQATTAMLMGFESCLPLPLASIVSLPLCLQ